MSWLEQKEYLQSWKYPEEKMRNDFSLVKIPLLVKLSTQIQAHS